MIITSTPRWRPSPAATPATTLSWTGRRRAVRRGPVRSGGPVPSRASGFTVFVFMAPAWLHGPGQHIGKTPGVPLIPTPRDQGRPAAVRHRLSELTARHPRDKALMDARKPTSSRCWPNCAPRWGWLDPAAPYLASGYGEEISSERKAGSPAGWGA